MFSAQRFKYGRLGQLELDQSQSISMPRLFPVVSLVTGTTAKGGGLWKYILQADCQNSLLRRNLPVLSQVLHFLDFIRDRPNQLNKWRSQGIIKRYHQDLSPGFDYTAPLFLDSGGFKLLWNQSIDLSAYGLSIENGQGPKSILQLQKDFGGQIIATLDYPLPPKLSEIEAKERMSKSINNAVETALLIQNDSDYNPFLYVAAHGQDRDSMGNYIKSVFAQFNREELRNYPFGFAVGSLVPLRGAHKYSAIINLILGLKENIPQEKIDGTPIHVFGITGSLIPILAYLGVDSFDSSSYIQEARGLGYIEPLTGRSRPILGMEEITCDCCICQNANLKYIQDALTSDIRGIPAHHGHYKSKYYADIALHNLEMDFRILKKTQESIKSDELQEYVIEHTEKFTNLRPALSYLGTQDDGLQKRLSRLVISMAPPIQSPKNQLEGFVSLQYTPEHFNILNNGYKPSADKQILLIIPCSENKPYSMSHSHRLITTRLEETFGEKTKLIHKVTLSGLYGPVPEEYELESAILGYDFRLDRFNNAQISLLTERLTLYLERYSNHYIACIGYATSMAYRTVLEKVAKTNTNLTVLPIKPKARKMTEFYRPENVAELLQQLDLVLRERL
jgi:tRNA-guanine family transglycosylase